jgi:hypothetical protein
MLKCFGLYLHALCGFMVGMLMFKEILKKQFVQNSLFKWSCMFSSDELSCVNLTLGCVLFLCLMMTPYTLMNYYCSLFNILSLFLLRVSCFFGFVLLSL